MLPNPNIQLVTRDGSITYAVAIRAGGPQSIQISDKFHLVQNLVKAIKEYISKSYSHLILLEDTTTANESTNSININDKISLQKYIKSEDTNNQELEANVALKWDLVLKIKEAHKQGLSQRQLAKAFSLSEGRSKNILMLKSPLRILKLIKEPIN